MSDYLDASAVISECGRYRWVLRRRFRPEFASVLFVMLNPSTADGAQDDPTIRRCVGFARAWGYGAISVVNLFAFRATDPKNLERCHPGDRIGLENDATIEAEARVAALVVAAWGAHWLAKKRGAEVLDGPLRTFDVHAIAKSKDGAPRHPLYLKADLTPVLTHGRRPPLHVPGAP